MEKMSQETPKEDVRIIEEKVGSIEKEKMKVEIKIIESSNFTREQPQP